jgi:ABC-type multidrug transport system fused ATPase/permease subunit
MSKQKKKQLNECQIMKLCLKYYLTDINNVQFLLFLLLLSIVTRRIINYIVKNLIYEMNNSNNIHNDCVSVFKYTLLCSISSAAGDYIILSCSAIFQTNISVKALTRILKYESSGRIDLASGKTQYAISEGSFAMSKLFEHCFLEIFLKASYFISDFSLIYSKTTIYHVYFSFFITIIASYIHFKGASIAMKCKKDINEARGLCDKNLYEDITNYEIIKSFQTEDRQIRTYREKINPWRNASIYHAKTTITSALIHDFIFSITAYIFTLLLRYNDVTDKNVYKNSYGCLKDLELSIENVSTIFRKYKESMVTSRMLLYYLEEIDGFSPGTSTKRSFDDSIIFKDVSYSINNINIFKNINFSIRKNEKVCIFGRNGSGKSTISRIIMRLCYVDAGRITMDGIDIYQILITNYRSLITYVPQETNLFDDTVFNNLTYGNDESFTHVIEECKKMHIHEDILRLENGYNTCVGERGVNINGGLRQKIFYVRAILTKAQIYIFDEPTNNLDESSAFNVIDLILGETFADKTVLVICHDHEMVQRFPKILKFADGKIIEEYDN